MRIMPLILVLFAVARVGAAERINQDGRILGAAPTVASPTLFDTAQADAIVAAMQIFPVTNAWNEDVSGLPLLGGNNANSAPSNAMIQKMFDDVLVDSHGDTHTNHQRLVAFKEMNYVLVPDNQTLVDMRFRVYPGQSDFNGGTSPIATWPLPSTMPVEGWPSETGSLTLNQWQRDINNDGGDRHSVVVQPSAGRSFETWQAILTGNSPAWEASNGAIFDLTTNASRPLDWTSGDAAGLSLFPALVRYDEAERGMVEHAMRLVVRTSRMSYLYPATHQAGSTSNSNTPAMGQRLRLKASYDIPPSWTKEERAIALGLKKYGALVADNGNFCSISVCPDERWPSGCFDHLASGATSDFLDLRNFEVVESTGATQGPRSAGAPTVNAGADQGVTVAAGATLSGSATGSGLTTTWYVYPNATPPGIVTFANAAALATTANFSATGTYTLMLKASDGVHATAYDAVVITVASAANPTPTLSAISPVSANQHGSAFTMTLTGSSFVTGSVVKWSGKADLTPASVSATQLTVTVPASYLLTPGSASITVFNPAPGGGTSAARTFTIVADTTPPMISAVMASGISDRGATITWSTNEAADSQVEYGLTAAYGSATTLNAASTTSHTQPLSGLVASTLYYYRVKSRDGAGNLATSSGFTFTTSATPAGGTTKKCGLGGLFAALGLSLALSARRGARRPRESRT